MLLTESLLGSSSAEQVFIEDVFSTFLYTGNGSTQTITNGIDLTGKGGLVWLKSRSGAASNALYDTVRGAPSELSSNSTAGQVSGGLSGFLANGFSLNSQSLTNANGATYASWTFREQPKFFDIVTYTGNGVENRQIAHNLQSVPGCIIIKRTDASSNWWVAARPYTGAFTNGLSLNLNIPFNSGGNNIFAIINDQYFELFRGPGADAANISGGTYVAYIFAHNAGGFGATGTDNVISCGSYEGNGSTNGPTITLGYEPQWVMIKRVTEGTGDWNIIDNMRGFVVGGTDAELNPNLANAESTGTFVTPTATGFQLNTNDANYNAAAGSIYIYIAIRRGPMRTPTSGASVFETIARSGTSSAVTAGSLQAVDWSMTNARNADTQGRVWFDRLRGQVLLRTNSTAAESSNTNVAFDVSQGIRLGSDGVGTTVNQNFATYSQNNFRRAPGFFDVVCYTGNGASSRRVPANLAAVPQFVIVKSRSSVETWSVGTPYTVSPGLNYSGLRLNSSAAQGSITISYLYSAPPYVDLGVPLAANTNGVTYVAYAFASCPGVSRVGTYTGTGSTQTINCGFSSGARFVLIKRTDAAGDWYVWDSARGIVAANDPYLLLNSTAAEVTTTDWVDTAASGFELSNAGSNLVNTNGGQYIFLAIA